jgi:hypothetical protein
VFVELVFYHHLVNNMNCLVPRQQHCHLSGSGIDAPMWDSNVSGGGPDSLSNSSVSINSSGLTVIMDRQNNVGSVASGPCCHLQSSSATGQPSSIKGIAPLPLLPVLPSSSTSSTSSQLHPGSVYILEAVVPPSSSGIQQRSPFHILADMHLASERNR